MNQYEQQAIEFCEKTSTAYSIKFLRFGYYFPDDKEKRDVYYVTLRRTTINEEMHFTFGNSVYASQNNKKPTIYDVLACLTKYDPGSNMWEFAEEFGYEIHDEKTYKQVSKTFEAVQEEWEDVKRVFGDVLEELAEIQ